tara:strand:- start:1399 stop:2538 length:1140 start_codon:yes stop_codon:yes gene_type:complete
MQNQVDEKKRLQRLIDKKETDYANSIYLNPVKEYIDPKRDIKEKDVFFNNSPVCIGIASEIPNKGDWFTLRLIDTPILVVRKNDNDIVAYLNICSHRGAKIAKGNGEKAYSFKCPYHSWIYNLEGKLVGRPREKAFSKIPKNMCALKKIKLYNHNGFLWITLNQKAEQKYKKYMKNLKLLLKNYNLNNYYYYKSTKMYRKLNWKLAVDTFLEIYHIDSLHNKTLSPIIMGDLATFDSFGSHIKITGARNSILEPNSSLKTKKEFEKHTLRLSILFPNTILVGHHEHVEVWHVLPGKKENECEISLSLFSKEKIKTHSAKKHWQNNFTLAIDAVEKEDFPLGEDIQKGFYADPKRKLIFGENEPGLQHFHKSIKSALKKN